MSEDIGIGVEQAQAERRSYWFEVAFALVSRKRQIFYFVLAVALLSAGISLLLPNRFMAQTRILLPQPNGSIAGTMMGQLGALSGLAGGRADLGLRDPTDIYVTMLHSRTVADGMIRRFDLLKLYGTDKMVDARRILGQQAEIATEKGNIIVVNVEDRDPQRAADMANAFVDELGKLTQNLAVTEAARRRLFFERQLKQAKDDLANAEVELKKTQETTGLIQPEMQAKSMVESIGILRGQVAAKEVQLAAMRTFATNQNPDVIRLEQEIGGLRVQLAKLEKDDPSSANAMQIPTKNVPAIGLEYVRRVRDVKYYETIFEVLAKQFEAAKIDESRDAPVIQVMDVATRPEKKTAPTRRIIVMVATSLALFLAVCWALADELWRRFMSVQENAGSWAMLKSAVLPRTSLNWSRISRRS